MQEHSTLNSSPLQICVDCGGKMEEVYPGTFECDTCDHIEYL